MRESIKKIRTNNGCNKGFVHYFKRLYNKEWKNDNPKKGCPLCNKVFEIGDPIFMVITYKSFPNTLIHQSCVDHDFILITHALGKSYNIFLKFYEEHKGWEL